MVYFVLFINQTIGVSPFLISSNISAALILLDYLVVLLFFEAAVSEYFYKLFKPPFISFTCRRHFIGEILFSGLCPLVIYEKFGGWQKPRLFSPRLFTPLDGWALCPFFVIDNEACGDIFVL